MMFMTQTKSLWLSLLVQFLITILYRRPTIEALLVPSQVAWRIRHHHSRTPLKGDTASINDSSAAKVNNSNSEQEAQLDDDISSRDNNRSQNQPRRRKKKKGPKGSSSQTKLVRPRIPILQYHNDWVCVNKPAGMTVHRNAESLRLRQLVVSTTLKRQLSRKVWPVHRLDHRTSGALLFAFNSQVCGQLHASLTNKEDGSKDYVALLRGGWGQLPETLLVDQPVRVDGVDKESQTEFRLLASMGGNGSSKDDNNNNKNNNSNDEYDAYQGACSLVHCRLLTGRKHQIRRHAFAIGHPVVGDTEHGDSKVNRWWRENRQLNRLFLHCLSLDLPPLRDSKNNTSAVGMHFETKDTPSEVLKRIQCIAPLPSELSCVLRSWDMQELWNVALKKDPRLAMESFDEIGGTSGRGAKALETMVESVATENDFTSSI